VAWDRTVSENGEAWQRPFADPIERIRGGLPVGYFRSITPILPDEGFEGIDHGDKYIFSYSPYAGTVSYEAYQVSPSAGVVFTDPEWTYHADTPHIATISDQGVIRRVAGATGWGFFRVESARLAISDRFRVPIGQGAPEYIPEPALEGYKPGTLGEAMVDSISSLSALAPSSNRMQIYTTVPSNSDYVDWYDKHTGISFPKTKGAVGQFVRNTDPEFIGNGINLTCVSPGWKKAGESTIRRTQTATLISPRCFISCNHANYWPDEGGEVLFVDNTDTVHSATVVATTHVGADMQVGLLDADIPGAISPLKFIHQADLLAKTTRWTTGNPESIWNRLSYIPVIQFTQHELLVPSRAMEQTSIMPMTTAHWELPGTGPYGDWGVDIYAGDSGNPVSMVLNGDLIALSFFYYPQSGPHILIWSDSIQGGMDALTDAHSAPAQTLTYADVSAYPDQIQI